MKNTDKTAATKNEQTDFASIDTVALDDVSGGCAACGSANCQLPNVQQNRNGDPFTAAAAR